MYSLGRIADLGESLFFFAKKNKHRQEGVPSTRNLFCSWLTITETVGFLFFCYANTLAWAADCLPPCVYSLTNQAAFYKSVVCTTICLFSWIARAIGICFGDRRCISHISIFIKIIIYVAPKQEQQDENDMFAHHVPPYGKWVVPVLLHS